MMQTKKIPIYIDTDMGNDDLIAIAMLMLSKKLDIKVISTVFGVASVNKGTNNLAKILTYINQNIPIVKGKTKALNLNWNAKFPKIDCLRANNLTLLKNLNIPTKSKNIKTYSSIESFYQIIQKESKKITLVCLGPLTNIAYLIKKYQEKFTNKINQIILMGGAINSPGIVPPANISEYNIYLDPESAKIVFNLNIPITVVPIDATQWVPAMFMPKKIYSKIKLSKPQNKISQLIKELIINNNSDFDYFYDPLVSAIMEKPQIIKQSLSGDINIVSKGKNRGQAKLLSKKKGNIQVISKVNPCQFYNQLLKRIYEK